MADLSEKTGHTIEQIVLSPPSDEYVLCKIRAHSNGTIAVEPDFNCGKMAYIVETANQNNEAYHYYVEHASENINADDLVKEKKLFNEICLRQQMHLRQLVGNDFDIVNEFR